MLRCLIINQKGRVLIMSDAVPKKRQFDLREGARKHVVAVRFNKAELLFLDKMCAKLKVSRSAFIIDMLNNFKQSQKK